MSQKKRLKCWVERENKRRHQSGKRAGLSLSTNSRTKHIFLELIMVAGSNIYVRFSGSFFFFFLFFLFDGFVFCFVPVPHSPTGMIGHKGKQKRRRRTLREGSSLRQSRTLKAKKI